MFQEGIDILLIEEIMSENIEILHDNLFLGNEFQWVCFAVWKKHRKYVS